MTTQHHTINKYVISRQPGKLADTFTVVYETRENISHHESLAEARKAIAIYEAADNRRKA